MGTFVASIYGIVFLLVSVGTFALSRLTPAGSVRTAYRIGGLVIGAALTAWWINDPISEGSALLILASVFVLAAVLGSALQRTR